MDAIQETPDQESLLKLEEVAERLQISRTSVYKLIYQGELKSIRIPRTRSVRVRRRDLTDFIESLDR